MSDALPALVIQEVKAALQSIAALTNKVVFIYDESDLQNKIKGVSSFPAAGIVYEGMRSVGDPGPANRTHRIGIAAELVFSIIVIMQPETMVRTDAKTPVIDLLDSIRGSILGTRSVTGHFFRFMVEAPASLKNGMAFWVQRWAVPILLPPVQNQ